MAARKACAIVARVIMMSKWSGQPHNMLPPILMQADIGHHAFQNDVRTIMVK
jgi:hypothetical protein